MVRDRTWGNNVATTPIEYREAERFDTVYNIVTPAGRSQQILAGLIVADIRYSEIVCPQVVITPADAQLLVDRIAATTSFLGRWPDARLLLEKYLTYNRGALSSYQRGYVLAEGKWQSRAIREAQIEEARRLAEERQRIAAETARERQRALEEQQQAQQLQARALETAQIQRAADEQRKANAESASRQLAAAREAQARSARLALENSEREENSASETGGGVQSGEAAGTNTAPFWLMVVLVGGGVLGLGAVVVRALGDSPPPGHAEGFAQDVAVEVITNVAESLADLADSSPGFDIDFDIFG